MNPSERLEYVSMMSKEDVRNLWLNCFSGKENLEHMNRYQHELEKITNLRELTNFIMTPKPLFTVWGIRKKGERHFIGYICYLEKLWKGIAFVPDNIGISIGLNNIGKGYSSESIRTMLDYLEQKGESTTFAVCVPEHIVSRRCLESCGFSYYGKFKWEDQEFLEFEKKLNPKRSFKGYTLCL
jgi:RimJ/RimL family protein N-acetyltransferase